MSIYVGKLNTQLKNRGIQIVLSKDAEAQLLEEGYDADFGARPMKRVFQKRIQDKLALELLRGGFKSEPDSLKSLRVDYDHKKEIFSFS